jgi:M6 family metalloprotease-like protein
MKKIFIFAALLAMVMMARTAPIDFMPVTIYQPDGTEINCFASGDEFFNFLHDAEGYTIIQGSDGWYYYGITSDGLVVPSQYVAATVNPATVGLTKWAKISPEEYKKKKDAMWAEVEAMKTEPVRAPHNGTMNNLCVYIRFADDAEITTTRQTYDDKLNPSTGNSLKSYFYEVSYNMLTINSTHYPACAMTTNLSYQDSHNRSYFQPYNASTNPNGYQNDTERRTREHALLRDAITWINTNSPVPGGLNIDADNDGYVDNVCFFIKGNSGGWGDLLWAHRWVLYTYNVQINGKRVYDYTFQPENQVGVRTLCHEMFHALGAPDLYHYYYDTHISPAGYWDLMESGSGHMTAYMKWKYSDQTWIASIPEITTSGTYTLNPLSSSTNNCYKIASPNSPNEFFVVEYRQKTGTFETNVPGSGLIVYRINPLYDGNADGPPDELYIYRPNGTLSVNGTPNSAHFSAGTGRTEINDGTNPSSFLTDGSAGGLDIWGVTTAGSTISFNVGLNDTYDVVLDANPSGAGTLAGAGTYFLNDNVTVTATASPGFNFVNWTENAVVVSTSQSYNFTITDDRHLVANFVSNGVTCDTISNIEGSAVNYTWSSYWGFVSGHSGRTWTQFAEKYTGVSQLWVTGLMVAVSKASDNGVESPVVFKVYDNGAMPGTVLATKSVNINTLNAGYWNYIEFDNPVLTTGNYYLGYEITYTAPHDADTFAVYLSNYSQTTGNTAYAYTPTGWDSYNNLVTSVTFNSHLWIESINCTPSWDVILTADPAGGGTVTGDGSYADNILVTVTASPNPGYAFVNWTEGVTVVSTSDTYQFNITADRTLTANFQVLTSCEEYNLQQISVYPNPVSDIVCVDGIPSGTSLTITDLQGREISITDLTSIRQYIDMSELNSGIYLLHFVNQGDAVTRKVLKQ